MNNQITLSSLLIVFGYLLEISDSVFLGNQSFHSVVPEVPMQCRVVAHCFPRLPLVIGLVIASIVHTKVHLWWFLSVSAVFGDTFYAMCGNVVSPCNIFWVHVSWVILKRCASVNLNDHFFALVSVIHNNIVAVFLSYFERPLFFRVEFTRRFLSNLVE